MKVASGATLSILATGQFHKADLYDITLSDGVTMYSFTDQQAALVVGAVSYGTGLTIQRGATTLARGMDVQSMDLTILPQLDKPGGVVQIAGQPFLAAARNRVFDGARILYSKIFLRDWNDTSPGKVPWFQGRLNEVVVGRSQAVFTVNSDIEMLNVAMPRNLIQSGCVHTLYDSGCTLLATAFTVNATTSGPTNSALTSIATGLTQADGYFNLGVLTFTTGPYSGLSRVVRQYHSGGQIDFIQPLPGPDKGLAGSGFKVRPGCPKTQAACSNSNASVAPPFNNLAHFRGYPYVPLPETLYSGGISSPPATTQGQQGAPTVGTPLSSKLGRGSYTP